MTAVSTGRLSSGMANGRSDFRDRQLGPTLAHAAAHPFYREHWGAHARDAAHVDREQAWDLLDALPPLGRDHLSECLAPQVEPDDEIVGMSFSSGSSGSIVSRYVTAKERALAAALTSRSPTAPTERRPLRLELVSTWHGVGAGPRDGAVLLPGSVVDDLRIERTIQMLRTRFDAPGIETRASVLSGGIVGVHTLTRYLIDRGIPASEFRIRVVGVFGGYVGRRRRQWLTDYWEAPVIDSFSTSECRGKALVCPACGHLAFDPQLVPQALALGSDEPVTSGEGRLALTELHPFGLAQPIVKYVTGDLVEHLDDDTACCSSHRGGLRRLGRIETSLIADVDEAPAIIVPSQVLYDAFDRAGVSRADPFHGVRGIIENDLDQPYVEASLSTDAAGNLRVRCRYRPDGSRLSSDAAVRAALLERPTADGLARAGRLDVEVVADETTPPPRMKWA
jgi:phenylacetate-coenzyme A ligase PaaK-like adenylate-forming protein